MSQETKFTEQEIQQITDLQNKYQTAIFQLGEVQIRKYALEEEFKNVNSIEKKLQEEYISIQKDEDNLLQQLSEKYGNGTLNIKTGTFTPA